MNPFLASLSSVAQLDLSATRSLLKEVVDDSSDARWGVYQASGIDNAVSLVARGVEQAVFSETNYGLSADEMQVEFGPFDKRSVWTLLVHHDSLLPVAAVRSIVGPAASQKVAADLADYWGISWADAARGGGWNPDDQFVEACTYSVLREWRTADGGWPVKVAVAAQTHLAVDLGAVASTQIINPVATRVFRRWGVPFRPIAPATLIKGAPFEASFIPNERGEPWLRSADDEFVRLVRHRATDGRGGTRLQPIDLDHDSIAVAHNKRIYDLDGVSTDRRCADLN